MVQDRGTIDSELFHSITASCKNLPHCDESAKEARAKLFSMWYSFGPPAVFFTISPGDECSFGSNCALTSKCNCCRSLEWKIMK